MAHHNELGKKGEKIAAAYLAKNGYAILAQNFYFDKAELDIVAQKNKGTIVVVEVKTRASDFFGNPQDFVSPSKIKLLVKAANEYVISKNLDVSKISNVKIYNSTARLIYKNNTFEEKLNIKNLSSGVYFIKIILGDQQVVKKIIIK